MADAQAPRAVTRALLDLIAEVMEASFHTLGQGVIMGSMPAYVRRFGSQNARYVDRTYMRSDAARGAVSALGPINFVSSATGTRFSLPVADAGRAVKRLHECEFLLAFAGKSDFAKAMVCRLHEAVYEGSVNGLLDDPERDGYRVSLLSRILFGQPHCDFQVDSVPARPGPDPGSAPGTVPEGDTLQQEQHHFYAAILVAFLEYLCEVLPEEDVVRIVAECSERVGQRVAPELDARSPLDLVRLLLVRSDRHVEEPAAQVAGHPESSGAVTVSSCPFLRPIKGSTRHLEAGLRDLIRRSACGTCTSVLQGAVAQSHPGASVERAACMATGDATCRFEVDV